MFGERKNEREKEKKTKLARKREVKIGIRECTKISIRSMFSNCSVIMQPSFVWINH